MEAINLDRDEEKAYVLLMTFLDICSAIRKTQDYKKDKVSSDSSQVKLFT